MTFKILTIGESGVGKTCILRRFVDKKFVKSHLATIGIDYKATNVSLGDKTVKIKIWDTAGQERFRNITQQYYKGADGIVLVFDVTEMSSFDKINYWMRQITTNTQLDKVSLVLLGNKVDIEPRVVTSEMGEKLSKEIGVKYFETSAMTNQNIEEAFHYISKEIMTKKEANVNLNTNANNNDNNNNPQEENLNNITIPKENEEKVNTDRKVSNKPKKKCC